MPTRRQFVMASAAGAAGALLPALSVAAVPPGEAVQCRPGGFPAQCVFEALRGESFRIAQGGETLSLAQVHGHPLAAQQPLEQFSLVMRGGAGQALEPGVYELRHEKTGRFAMHLAPSGRDASGPLYRADISLLL